MAFLLSSGCSQEGIIPSGEMEALLTEFYLADAAVDIAMEQTPGGASNYDSLRIYRPILEKHGFTEEDFRVSLDYYLHNPKRMTRILEHTCVALEEAADRSPGALEEEEVEGVELVPVDDRVPEPTLRRDMETRDTGAQQKPALQRKMRKKMTKQDLKKLEEELKR